MIRYLVQLDDCTKANSLRLQVTLWFEALPSKPAGEATSPPQLWLEAIWPVEVVISGYLCITHLCGPSLFLKDSPSSQPDSSIARSRRV